MMKFLLLKFFQKFHALPRKLSAEYDRQQFLSELNKNIQSTISSNPKIGKNTSYLISETARIQWGKSIDLRNFCSFVVGKNAELMVGDSVFMNNFCSVNCLEKIVIGKGTLFGEGVKLYDHNHRYTREKVEPQEFNTAPISIGKNCWLGTNVVVLKGVTIGDNSIIGAGCIIHKDIPANSMVLSRQELAIMPL